MTKIVGSSWTHYIWQGSQVIGEHDATTPYSTNPTYQVKSARLDYTYSGGRMIHSRQRASSTAPWTTQYYLSDRLSARMTLDSSGNLSGRQGHLPFGEAFAESGTQEKHHFTTYERDGENGLDYAVNRHYTQSVGRFIQVDPYSGSARMEAPQSWNRYSYAHNEPVDQIDPQGLDSGNPYCGPWQQNCDHIIPQPGFSWFLKMTYEPGAGVYDGRPISDWRPVGSPRSRPRSIHKRYSFALACGSKSAAQAMAQLQHVFTDYASFDEPGFGGNSIEFERVPITDNARIAITLVYGGLGIPLSANVHVESLDSIRLAGHLDRVRSRVLPWNNSVRDGRFRP